MANKILPALMIATAMCGQTAMAKDESPFSYTYFEGAYVHDNFDADGAAISDGTSEENVGTLFGHAGYGGAARLSVEVAGNEKWGFHIVSDYLSTDHNPAITIVNNTGLRASGIVDARHSEFRIAGGLNFLLSKKISLYTELGYVNNEAELDQAAVTLEDGVATNADISPFSGSQGAFDGRFGLRALIGQKVELTGFVRYHGNGELIGGDDGHVSFASKVKGGLGAFYRFNKTFSVGADYEIGAPGRLRMVARVSF